MNIFQDAMNASMPGTAKQFLGSVQAKPVGQMIVYVAILSVLPFIGYLVGGLVSWFGLTWGLIMGVIMYIGTIVAVIGSGFALAALSNSVAGRQISNDEAVTLVGYAATPAIVIGLLTGILTGFWGWGGIAGAVLGFLAWIYMAYLLFLGSGVRYGADRALGIVAVTIIAWIVISFIFSAIAGAIAWQMIVGAYMGQLYGGYNPYAGNPYAGLGRYY